MAERSKSKRKIERLRVALRENLKRRRAQAKERSATEQDGSGSSTPAHESAGIGADKRNR